MLFCLVCLVVSTVDGFFIVILFAVNHFEKVFTFLNNVLLKLLGVANSLLY